MTEAKRERVAAVLDRSLGIIGAVVLFAMMSLTFTDVILRYFFNAPMRGAQELTELMLVVTIFCGLPLVSRNDKHATTDLIDSLLTERAARVLATVIHLILSAALAGLAWLVWARAHALALSGDTTASLRIPLSPFVYLMSSLIFITAIVHIMKAFRGELHGGGPGNV